MANAKLKAFVDKARATTKKMKEDAAAAAKAPNINKIVKTPAPSTVTSTGLHTVKQDVPKIEESPGKSPAEEDQEMLNKLGGDWMEYDKMTREADEIENDLIDTSREISSGPSDRARRKFTLNLSKMRRR